MNPFFTGIVARVRQIFDPATVSDLVVRLLADVVIALVVLAAFYLLWRLLAVVVGVVLRRSKIDTTTVSFVNTLLKFGLFTVGVVTALDTAGVETSAVLASLGVAGLTIGFAARDALSNIISGILIFLDRPFTIGDLVEIQGAYGRVEKITLRSTRVVTPDGKMLAIPNTAVINNTVASYTNFPHLRLDIPVTVGVAEDLGRVRDILLALVAENPAFMTEPPPRVHVTQLNDYNVAVRAAGLARKRARARGEAGRAARARLQRPEPRGGGDAV